jgi:hypothetical protein
MLGLFGRFVIVAIITGTMKSAPGLPYTLYLLKGKLSHITVPSDSRGSLGPGQ